jgi:hypothetical protein
MFGSIRRWTAQSFLAAVAACCLPLAAQAGTINIILSDMDVLYMGDEMGGAIFDAMGGINGGNLVESEADSIGTAYFEMNGAPANGTLAASTLINTAANGDDIRLDFLMQNIGATVPKNMFLPSVGNNANGFGLDFFTDTGLRLRLTTTNMSLRISNNVFTFDGEGTLYSQNLPFGLAINQSLPVVYSYTATLPSVPVGGNGFPIAQAVASGALTISGIMVPEPATNLLLGSTAVAMGFVLLRRKRAIALAPVFNRRA